MYIRKILSNLLYKRKSIKLLYQQTPTDYSNMDVRFTMSFRKSFCSLKKIPLQNYMNMLQT